MRSLVFTRHILLSAWLVTLATQAIAAAPVTTPDTFADQVMQAIEKGDTKAAGGLITGAAARPESAPSMVEQLKPLDGKTIDFLKKVVDSEVEGALRQLIYYSHTPSLGFVYFRFNFKMTKEGWVLTSFQAKEEATELFPRAFMEVQ